MTLRQLTKPIAPLKLDVQKPDENINPLVPEKQDPSSGLEDYPIPNYQFKILMIFLFCCRYMLISKNMFSTKAM